MTALALLLAALACPPRHLQQRELAPPPSDTVTASAGDSVSTPAPTVAQTLQARTDTVRRRPKAIEVSDAYELRLRVHRYASYTMIPLFAVQTVAGNQLYVADQNGTPRPGWAKSAHGAGAAAIGTVFAINTVTGLWNLWDSRQSEQGRTKRWLHSALLLGSDAGFTWAGIKLADDAKHSGSGREQHRRVSFISMGAALAGYAVMLVGDH